MDYRWVNEVRPDLNGKPERSAQIRIEDLALAGAMETLGTDYLQAAWLRLFTDALADHPNNWLIWRRNGLGVGRELRRGFSALMGRFMARAWLTSRAGCSDFMPLTDDVTTHLGVTVKRKVAGIDLPDWICAGPSDKVVLAEAKGSWATSRNAPRGWGDQDSGPIAKALRQLENVEVIDKDAETDVSLKTWAVASRWSSEHSSNIPFLVAWDPEREGNTPRDRQFEIKGKLRRLSTVRILNGLGEPAGARSVLNGDVPDGAHDRLNRALRVGTKEMRGGYAALIGWFGVVPSNSPEFALAAQVARGTKDPCFLFHLSEEEIEAAAKAKPRRTPRRNNEIEEKEQFMALVHEATTPELETRGAIESFDSETRAFTFADKPQARGVRRVRRYLGRQPHGEIERGPFYESDEGISFIRLDGNDPLVII